MFKIDVLNRNNIKQFIIEIIKTYSKNKEYVSFGLNGEQGVGKTFIVEHLINNLEQYKIDNEPEYFIVNYNCWKNDYYDEPLESILISIYNAIEESKDKFGEFVKSILIEVSKDIAKLINKSLLLLKPSLFNILSYILKIYKQVKNQSKVIDKIDKNINLKEVLNKVRRNLEKISKEKTIIVFVDELDRCLPEYSIKVLERLHNIFDSLNNVIVIMIYDDKLLNNAIKNIFGEDVSASNYLKKFMSFDLRINKGEYQDELFEKYDKLLGGIKNYRSKEFIKCMLQNCNIEIRKIDKMIDNIVLINRMLNVSSDNENYISIVEFELIIYILRMIYLAHKTYQANDDFYEKLSKLIASVIKKDNSSIYIGESYLNAFILECRRHLFPEGELNDGKLVTPGFNYSSLNLIHVKVILDKLYSINEYGQAIYLSQDTIDLCKKIVKYLFIICE